MRLTFLLLTVAIFGGFVLPNRAEAAQFSALLVTASKSPGPSDSRLKPYEATLRRILRFESFRLVGQGSTELNVPGKGRISLGGGHHLQLDATEGNRVDAVWLQGDRTLMRTGLSLRGGVPAVLGGPGTGKDGEVYAVIVISQ
ncbi:MAG TPA: hypothetical protein PLN52_08235 [Opitutaceae bacterium]|nr:hypothetical protein [Opitutaceae bacterium]